MLVEWFVDHALGLVVNLTGLLPEVTLSLGDASTALAWALTFDGIVPVSEALIVFTQLLIISGLMFTWRVLRTLMSHIPAIGGSG